MKGKFLCALVFAAIAGTCAPGIAQDEFKVVGRVVALTEVQVNSSLRLNDRAEVKEVLVEEGDYVLKSQLMVRLDNREVMYTFRSAEEQKNDPTPIKEAERTVREAERLLQQADDLHNQGAGRKEDVENARFTLERVEIELERRVIEQRQKELAYELSKKRLQDYDVCAPIEGIVAARYIDEGEMMGGSSVGQDQVVDIISIDEMYVVADVDVTYLTEVQEGDKVRVRTHHPETHLDGFVYYVSPIVDPASNTFQVKVKVKNRVLSREEPQKARIRKIKDDASVEFEETEVSNREYLIRPGVYADVIFTRKPKDTKSTKSAE